MNRNAAFALPLILLTAINAPAAILAGDWSFRFSYRLLYDDNLLSLSSHDRNRFLDQQLPYPQPISTLDDLRSDFKATTIFSFESFAKNDLELKLVVNFASHYNNSVKNLGWLNFSVSQELGSKFKISGSYFYEPRYYIRNYRDIHSSSPQRCEFELEQWTGSLSYRHSKLLEFAPEVRWKNYYYNRYFTQYDGNLFQAGGEAIIRHAKWRITGGYNFVTFNNTGFDENARIPVENIIDDTEAGNGDYEQDEFTASVLYPIRLWDRSGRVMWTGSLAHRVYTSRETAETDPIHYGREDWVSSHEVSGRWAWKRNLDLLMGVGYGQRDSNAQSPLASLLKDNQSWSAWFEIIYELK